VICAAPFLFFGLLFYRSTIKGAGMEDPITIVGGNIAGLSAAWYLAKKGCPVTVYETKIWDKPCGGAISIEFAQYLRQKLAIDIKALDQRIPRVKFGFNNERYVETEGIFVIISRQGLQRQLIERLSKEPNINIIFKGVSKNDDSLFTPQTILATGFSGFTKKILQDQWRHLQHAATLKCEGTLSSLSETENHLILFDSRINGYRWFFFQPDQTVNIGVGGLMDLPLLHQHYDGFVEFIKKNFNYHFTQTSRPRIWKVPILLNNWDAPVSFLKNKTEFIGVGDVLGLAHPFLAAGIEPAWQSGWLVGESFNPVEKRINTARYRHLLKKNQQLTSRKRFDVLVARLLRFNHLPFKDQIAFILLNILKNPIINKLRKYPWFAMVHDGNKKTGFTISSG
jgi:flavin-dependent dehydrogenase